VAAGVAAALSARARRAARGELPVDAAVANKLAPKLRTSLADGPEVEMAPAVDIPSRIRELAIPLENIAVLVRTNARAVDYEEAFHDAGIPFQGVSLLDRDAARRLLRVLPREGASVGEAVRRLALAEGWLEHPPEKLGDREQTRQADLGRLVRLASTFEGSCDEFAASLRERFGASAGKGVHLLTLHRAKGLEFDAVFLPRLDEGELPSRRGDVDEERRLLYVGITRARRHLVITWSGKPSRFLKEIGNRVASNPVAAVGGGPVFDALKQWRLERSREDEVPPYVVFHNTTLAEIAERQPRSLAELALIPGVGPTKLERYGQDVLRVCAA
jgi:DNA helicase II / ATP-dependent DNA helicase PcrA